MMNVDPVSSEKVVATVQTAEVSSESGSKHPAGEQSTNLPEGKLLQAKIISVSDNKMVLQVGDKLIQAEAVKGVVAGQTITIRLEGSMPNVMMEVISDRLMAEQNLGNALKAILTTSSTSLDFWNNLRLDLGSLLSQATVNISPELQSAIQQLQSLQQPLLLSGSSAELSDALKEFVARLGLDLESMLKASVLSGEKPEGLQNNIKALLGVISASIAEQNVQLAGKEFQIPASAKENLLQLIEQLEIQVKQRLGKAFGGLTDLLKAIRSDIQALPRTGEGAAFQLESIINNLRSLPNQESLQLPTNDKVWLQQQVEQLVQNINERLGQTEEGRNVVERILLNAASRSTEGMHERLEAFQTVNSHLGERGQQLQLMFPVDVLGEMTEVQVRQFMQQQDNKEKTLTVVIKLELETLGAIRIDALAQETTLYCNVFVEKRELVSIVEELSLVFAEQLEARGLQLGRLVCKLDQEKIENFSDVHEHVLSPGEGLIDFQV